MLLWSALFLISHLNAQILTDRSPYEFQYDPVSEIQRCSPLDLRDQFLTQGLPATRKQGSSGWCYAFVLADLLSYELGFNASPAHVASAYFRAHPGEFGANRRGMQMNYPLGGGYMHLSFGALQSEGLCPEAEFPSEDYHPPPPRPLGPGEVKPPNEPLLSLDAQALGAHFPHPELSAMLEQIRFPDFRRVLKNLEHKECTKQTIPELSPIFRVRTKLTDRTLDPVIDALMDQQVPVGVSIDASFFARVPTIGMVNRPSFNHAVSLVGRRFNPTTERCEYLIRNSDSSCATYLPSYECAHNHLWVPRQIIQAGINALFSLQAPDFTLP